MSSKTLFARFCLSSQNSFSRWVGWQKEVPRGAMVIQDGEPSVSSLRCPGALSPFGARSGPSGLSLLTGLILAGLAAAPSPLPVWWGSLGPRPWLRSLLVAPRVTAAPARGGHAGGSPSPPGPLSLSPTDIGPVTLTADPALFQRELRELYVQVGSRPCAGPPGRSSRSRPHGVCAPSRAQAGGRPARPVACTQVGGPGDAVLLGVPPLIQ